MDFVLPLRLRFFTVYLVLTAPSGHTAKNHLYSEVKIAKFFFCRVVKDKIRTVSWLTYTCRKAFLDFHRYQPLHHDSRCVLLEVQAHIQAGCQRNT